MEAAGITQFIHEFTGQFAETSIGMHVWTDRIWLGYFEGL